jgi:hypothetical protein
MNPFLVLLKLNKNQGNAKYKRFPTKLEKDTLGYLLHPFTKPRYLTSHHVALSPCE